MYINVPGGTNAGWKRLRQKPQSWMCCGYKNQGYRRQCARCGKRRND